VHGTNITRILRGLWKFATPYFSLSSHRKFSNIQFLLMQYAQIPWLLQFSSPHLTVSAKSAESLKKLFFDLMEGHKLNVSENSRGLQI